MDTNQSTLPTLNDIEVRVLGSLIEKSKTTPDYYPMTLNSLTAACNQKSSRNPVVQYDEETVVIALNTLKRMELTGTATGGTNRSLKYKHNFTMVFTLTSAEVAVMCLLFLRGPLTVGEINSNSGRLYEFESLEEVLATIEKMQQAETPLIKQLARKHGQKEARYAQLLSPIVETEEDNLPEEPARKSVSELEARLIAVETDLAIVKEQLEKLMKELMG